MAEPTQADLRLMQVARTLSEGLDITRERVDKTHRAWLQADWRRLKAVEEAGSPARITFLTAAASAAQRDYDEALAYHSDRLASNADYIRKQVRGE